MKDNTPIAVLRKRASADCEALAAKLNEGPGDLWAAATFREFPHEDWETEEGETFWESFTALNQAEKAAIAAITR